VAKTDDVQDDQTLLALRTGLKVGYWLLAVWIDGKECCGTMKKPLKECHREIDDGKYDDQLLERLRDEIEIKNGD